MRYILKTVLFLVLGLVAFAMLMTKFGPREDATLDFAFDAAAFGGDLNADFQAQEARFSDITPGTEKRVIWAGASGARTPVALVYIHGFSATSEEIRPVPDRLAAALGANLVYTRLTGHGRPGDALGEARVSDWTRDTAEAIAAGQAVGDRVIVISTSTGGTLVAAAILTDPAMADALSGAIFVSPNFGINAPTARLLTWPAARSWIGYVAGERLSFPSSSDGHATYWTRDYPTTALLPVAALVEAVQGLEADTASVPAFFWYSPEDQVVLASETDSLAAAWARGGAPVTVLTPDLTQADDPYAHVVAGDILSPGQTDAAVAAMLKWIEALN
ncbi:alpha/beta hydrolase [Aestuariivita boseongensis]|uniref:alpha/beta hydrolase n=1 Tax=Aestuariivita boseongensis TaxID=1470562 RepID=UPI000681619F|nr:alpha/beta fold hydrolase [Aestuariivita boseongensis]